MTSDRPAGGRRTRGRSGGLVLDGPWPPWRREIEERDSTAIGRAPENTRQAVIKLLWVGVWLLYLGAPVSDLTGGGHRTAAVVPAALGLAAFVVCYLVVVFFRTNTQHGPERWVYGMLAAQTGLAVVLTAALGAPWLVLFEYVSVACGAALPARQSRWLVPGTTVLLAGLGAWRDPGGTLVPGLLVPCLLGGFAMVGVRQLVRTMVELREARATVAHLAATEERLRLARDLHDLLGHSLSLITLKSELAGRMLPDRPHEAAQQVADIERVSRQALVDVREAVSGYRRPTLTAELAAARGALRAAGIAARVHVPEPVPGLATDAESALAWALREAVTNVVRHSGAATCVVALATGGTTATLTVSDDGRGPTGPAGPKGPAGSGGPVPGNGLTGLGERLVLAGGSLGWARSGDGGFTLTASVPAARRGVGAELGSEGE